MKLCMYKGIQVSTKWKETGADTSSELDEGVNFLIVFQHWLTAEELYDI